MEILEIIRDALPEAIGGLTVAAIVALIGYLYTRWRKTAPKPVEGETVPPSPLKPPVPKIPHNLPQPGEFIGREREKSQVRDALTSRSYLVCIDGIGGIGKTALALEAAHECLRASKGETPADGIPVFDAFIWTTAKDRELALSDILDTIARTLDYPYIVKLPPEEKPSEAAKLLRVQKCLLIVDNFETITDDAVRDFLLNLPEPSKVLITSRYRQLQEAKPISLRGMEQSEALTLIRTEGKRLGLPAVEVVEDKVLLLLYKATGGAPLAIKWAMGQMKQRGQSLDTVLDYLYEAIGDIFKNIFDRSWEFLSGKVKCVLMVMPIFATSASKAAIEAASDVHKWDLDEALGQLVEMSLIEASEELDEAKRRYSIHPLTRAYAGARLRKNRELQDEVQMRHAAYFLGYAKQHGGYQNWAGYPELDREIAEFFAIFDRYYENGEWKSVIELMQALDFFMWIRGFWNQRISWGLKAVEASRCLEDEEELAWREAYTLGWTYLATGNLEEAEQHAETARRVAEGIGFHRGVAYALRVLGVVAKEKGLYTQSQELFEQSLHLWDQLNEREEVAWAKASLEELVFRTGNYERAQQLCEEYLMVFEDLRNYSGVCIALENLGEIALAQNDLLTAEGRFEEEKKLATQIGRLESIACSNARLAVVAEKERDWVKALSLAREALAVYERLRHTETEKTRELVVRLEARIAEARK